MHGSKVFDSQTVVAQCVVTNEQTVVPNEVRPAKAGLLEIGNLLRSDEPVKGPVAASKAGDGVVVSEGAAPKAGRVDGGGGAEVGQGRNALPKPYSLGASGSSANTRL